MKAEAQKREIFERCLKVIMWHATEERNKEKEELMGRKKSE